MFSSCNPAPAPASLEKSGRRRRLAPFPGLPGWLAGFVERFGKPPAERTLQVEERLMVGGKKSVLLIACHGRRFLLASSGDAMTPFIEVLPQTQPPAPCAEEGSL